MKKLQTLCYVIGVSQIILGGLYLFAPTYFIEWQNMQAPASSIHYILAMFSARLFVYGVGMFIIAQNATKYRIWLDGMIAIQLIDLLAGVYFTTCNVVLLADSFVPMFNASFFIILMLWLRRYAKSDAS